LAVCGRIKLLGIIVSFWGYVSKIDYGTDIIYRDTDYVGEEEYKSVWGL